MYIILCDTLFNVCKAVEYYCSYLAIVSMLIFKYIDNSYDTFFGRPFPGRATSHK